ncbi:hypothetical protein Tco_0577533 [Tanacetum coccineum]
MKLTTSRLIDGSPCGGIDMVIKDLDLEPKIDAMMRDFLELVLETSPCFKERFTLMLLEHQDVILEFMRLTTRHLIDGWEKPCGVGLTWTTPSMAWMEGTLPITLQSEDAEKWWNNEINETTITWSELNDKFFHKYYPLSHTCNSKTPDNLDNGTDYFEFIYWMASKFDNYWEIDKNTKNGLLEFYVNEHAKGTIGDLNEYKEPCSDTFYKPYLDAQEAKDIYEVINREYFLIPILARRDIDNPDELCRTEEFTVVRHSIGNDEEFVTVGPSKINTVERTPGSMSCIYHELFNKKDRGWEVTRTR